MTRKHGVTDEDVRRDEEKDERNFRAAREGAEGGGCCLLTVLAGAGSLVLVALAPIMSRWA